MRLYCSIRMKLVRVRRQLCQRIKSLYFSWNSFVSISPPPDQTDAQLDIWYRTVRSVCETFIRKTFKLTVQFFFFFSGDAIFFFLNSVKWTNLISSWLILWCFQLWLISWVVISDVNGVENVTFIGSYCHKANRRKWTRKAKSQDCRIVY